MTPPPPDAGREGTAGAAPAADPEIAVSIINYRTGAMTLRCVQSVVDDLAAGGTRGHVVVVDNASGDGSAEAIADWIAARPPAAAAAAPVTLIRAPVNGGFSGGHNRGLASAPARAAPATLVLNSDALLRPGFCAAILAAAADDPGAGLLAPRLEDEDGTRQVSCFRVPGPVSELVRGAMTGPLTRLLDRWTVPMEMPPAPGAIGWASFACILLRREMVEAIGPMDEDYFLYFEDTEYCLRARRAGWGIAYVEAARAVHLRGGSAPVKRLSKARKRLPGYYWASRARLMAQAHGRAGLWAANLAWLLGRGVAGLHRLAGRRVPPATEREGRDIWTGALTPLARWRSGGPGMAGR